MCICPYLVALGLGGEVCQVFCGSPMQSESAILQSLCVESTVIIFMWSSEGPLSVLSHFTAGIHGIYRDHLFGEPDPAVLGTLACVCEQGSATPPHPSVGSESGTGFLGVLQ